MDVEEFRIKPPWQDYEETLLAKGFLPCFEAEHSPLPISCGRCGTFCTYVVLTDDTATLGFVVCPHCGEWIGRAITGQRTGAEP
jgi:hypothetical protein